MSKQQLGPRSVNNAKKTLPEQKGPDKSDDNIASDEEVRKESSKVAQQAIAAQEKASELANAAIAAGDPQERQKLLNEALQPEIEAESFGKTAKWLSSGTFQGFLAGTGFGSVPGLTLGTLTGTLVGGLTTTITGGLGGAIGAAVGAVHGPFVKMGDVVGGALDMCLPSIPGGEATDKQKGALEVMLGSIKEQDHPSKEELQQLTQSSGPSNGAEGRNTEQSRDKELKNRRNNGSTPTKVRPQAPGQAAGQSAGSRRSTSNTTRPQAQSRANTNQGSTSAQSKGQSASSDSSQRPKQKPRKLEKR